MAIDRAEQQAFLTAIREDWENDTPRLAYADWLEENGGQSEKARAEFIRVQVALAAGHDGLNKLTEEQRAAYGKRQEELQVQHQTAWDEEQWADAPLFPEELRTRFDYDRGMPEGLNLMRTGITDEGLAHLAPLKNLRELNLWGANITDAGLAHLAPLKNLQTLNLTCCAITDDGLIHLAPLKNLRELNLWGVNITDAGLAHLAPLTGLWSLNLTWSSVTDEGLAHLAPLTQLRELNLWGTGITDADLVHLVPLENLHTLHLGFNDRITEAGLMQFAANPAVPAGLIIATEEFKCNTTVAALRKRAGNPQPGANPIGAVAVPAQAPEQNLER